MVKAWEGIFIHSLHAHHGLLCWCSLPCVLVSADDTRERLHHWGTDHAASDQHRRHAAAAATAADAGKLDHSSATAKDGAGCRGFGGSSDDPPTGGARPRAATVARYSSVSGRSTTQGHAFPCRHLHPHIGPSLFGNVDSIKKRYAIREWFLTSVPAHQEGCRPAAPQPLT